MREITSACKKDDCPYFDNYKCLLPFDEVCRELSSSATTTCGENGNIVMGTILKCIGYDENNYTPDYCDVCGEPIPGTTIYKGKKTQFAMCRYCKSALLLMRQRMEANINETNNHH